MIVRQAPSPPTVRRPSRLSSRCVRQISVVLALALVLVLVLVVVVEIEVEVEVVCCCRHPSASLPKAARDRSSLGALGDNAGAALAHAGVVV